MPTELMPEAAVQWDLIIGGFAFFLFGIQYMGDGLKSIAGDKLRYFIDKYTSKPWMGIIIGALVTVVIQSSSATTAIAIGFVRAGIMRLDQAIGVIMGANIGTTVTAFLIGLNVEQFSLYFVFIGVLFIVFSKRRKTTYMGEIILGFGILFFGLKLMGDELSMIGEYPQFEAVVTAMAQNPILALLGGTLMTGLVQSSSAVIGIIQKLYSSGAITIAVALPFVFGSNIGTTITAIFAAIGGSISSKRAAGIHVMFNVFGTLLFMLILKPFTGFISTVSTHFAINSMMQIAFAHIVFNISTTILAYPFINLMVKAVKTLIPGDENQRIEVNMENLDPKIAATLPAGALGVSKQATIKMGMLAYDSLKNTKDYFNTKQKRYSESTHQCEEAINSLDSKITDYLMEIAHHNLGTNDTDELIANLKSLKDIERMGDLAMNLREFYSMAFEEKGKFSEGAIADVNEMYDIILEMTKLAIDYFNTRDEKLIDMIQDKENYLDLIEEKARQRHFKRMAQSECARAITGSVYIDILSNLERVGDHACNIVRNCNIELPLHNSL